MHNSLNIRDRLREANNHPLYRGRRDPHRSVAVDPAARPAPGEFALAAAWRIEAELPAPVAAAVRDDLADFLGKCGARVEETARARLSIALAGDLPARACRLVLEPDDLRIAGGDVAGVWAGIAWFESEIRTRRGLILPRTHITRRAAWPVQISQGPWGGNYSVPDFGPAYLSDDAFRLYAHYGVNSMMIYGDLLCYVRSQILPELNHPEADHHLAVLQEAAARALRYGVRFTWVPVGPKLRPDHPVFQAHPTARGAGFEQQGPLHFLCSSDPSVLAFYEETFANLFRHVPELAGAILITWSESFYHCAMWADRPGHVPCPACEGRPRDAMVAGLVDAVRRGVGQGSPDAFTAMWVYTWPHGDRRAAFEALPPTVALFHHVDKDYAYHKTGYTKEIWDYSIDYRGPTPAMQNLARFAHDTARPLFVKTETGTGLEVFQFPYVPAMPRLAAKWTGVQSLRPQGVHQSWLFFGMCGTRAEELARWAAYAPEMSPADFLHRLAVRDFGPGAVPLVLTAWRELSEAVRHLPAMMLGNYYVGPTFLGPCHPLVSEAQAPVPEVFHAYLYYLQEGEETFSVKQIEETRTCLVLTDLPETTQAIRVIPDDRRRDGWELIAAEYEAATGHARAAVDAFQEAGSRTATRTDRQNWREERFLIELIYRTFQACAHTVQFLRARRRFEAMRAPDARARMQAIAQAERDNARAALTIYQQASWLDYAHRLDGKFSSAAAMIDEKMRGLDAFLGPRRG